MNFTRKLSCLALILALGRPLAGQQTTREVQVPLDPERGVMEIGTDLRRELGLFVDVAGFQVARLFRQDDGSLILEISRVEGGVLTRERQRLADAALTAFRVDLGARLVSRGQSRVVKRSGRSGLVLMETLLGVGLYGWAVPVGLDIESSRGTVAAYMLTAGLSFYLPYRITRNASVSITERNAAVWGGTRGIAHGLMLGNVLTGPDEPYDPNDPNRDENDDRITALAMLGTSVVETVIGYQIADALDASEGEVALWGAAGDFGISFGYALSYVAGLFDEDVEICEFDYCYVEEFRGARAGHGAALAVAMASPWIAHLTGEGVRYTIGDVRALRSFGLLGAQLALPGAWAAFRDDDQEDDIPGRPVVGALLAGSAAGIWLSNRALASRSLSGGDGLLVLAGHMAGGLGALGVTYLLDSGESADELVYMTTSALGSAAGSLLTLRAVSGGLGSGSNAASGARFELSPAAALLPWLGERGAVGAPLRAPFLTIRF